MTDLISRTLGSNSKNSVLHDSVLQTGGILVDQNAYTAGLDRIYDVKGLANMYVMIKNTGGTNGLTYKIEKARKQVADITTLVDADFDKDIIADTIIAFGADDITDIIDISPESTAIRIRVKRETSGQDTTLAGFVLVN